MCINRGLRNNLRVSTVFLAQQIYTGAHKISVTLHIDITNKITVIYHSCTAHSYSSTMSEVLQSEL